MTTDAARTPLQERLQFVIDTQRITAHAWSRRAQLAGGHVSLVLSGDIKGALTTKTLEALADAAGCSYEWLATGRGEPSFHAIDLPAPASPEIEPAPVRDDDMGDVDRALFRVMGPTYEPQDFDAARDALKASYRKTVANADLEPIVKRALDAARDARLAGETPTVLAILSRVAFGRT